jgi:hypothetical protein
MHEDKSSRNETGACMKTVAAGRLEHLGPKQRKDKGICKRGVWNSKRRQEQQENRSSEEETGTAGRQKLKAGDRSIRKTEATGMRQ